MEKQTNPIDAALSYIKNAKTKNENWQALVTFVASFVHPDIFVPPEILDNSDPTVSSLAGEFFRHCASGGLSLEEQGGILREIQPYLNYSLH